MEIGDIPPEVWRFIADKIDTVPHLEALLLLWGDRAQAWTAESLAAAIYVSQESAAGILRDLAQRKLVHAEGGLPAQYQYNSEWDSTGELMPNVAQAYRRHLIRIATFIHSKASPGVREFAKAFEIKKER